MAESEPARIMTWEVTDRYGFREHPNPECAGLYALPLKNGLELQFSDKDAFVDPGSWQLGAICYLFHLPPVESLESLDAFIQFLGGVKVDGE